MESWIVTHVVIVVWIIGIAGWVLLKIVIDCNFPPETIKNDIRQMEGLALQNSILELESNLLSVDFYTWVDALGVVVEYLVRGDIPVFWPGISEYTDVPACDLVTKAIEFKKTTNHKLDYKLRWVYEYIPWNCTCGKRLGVTKAFSSEPVPGFAEHLKEIKELQSW